MKTWPLLSLWLVAAFAVIGSAGNLHTIRNKANIRVETRLIQVNVVARDSHGRPVAGLTKNDFRLYDNGKRVPIDVFSAISLKPKPAKPLPPNEYSNRLPGAPPSVTVVLLDGLNTSFSDQTWARTQVVRFLERLKPQDRVAIMYLGSHLFVLQNFSSNPKLLLAALQNAKTRNPKEVEASNPPRLIGGASSSQSGGSSGSETGSAGGSSATGGSASLGSSSGGQGAAGAAADEARMQRAMMELLGHESSFFVIDRVDRTTDALIAIANYLAHFPGRKNPIWVSASFPTSIGLLRSRAPGNTGDQIVFTQPLGRAYRALNNADIAVYPVDARGLTVKPGRRFFRTLGTMQEMAADTGGRAFYNTNDLVRPMRIAVDDYHADYTLGFYPRNIQRNGRYHSLKVKVEKRGVHLRYRRGYFATQESLKNETRADAALQRAIYAPLDSTGLGLTVTVLKSLPTPERRVELAIDMDAHDITLQSATAGRSVGLAVVLAQWNAEGRVLRTNDYNVTLDVAASGITSLMKQGLKLTKWVNLVQGADTLELVARDPASGNIGSVRIPVGNW